MPTLFLSLLSLTLNLAAPLNAPSRVLKLSPPEPTATVQMTALSNTGGLPNESRLVDIASAPGVWVGTNFRIAGAVANSSVPLPSFDGKTNVWIKNNTLADVTLSENPWMTFQASGTAPFGAARSKISVGSLVSEGEAYYDDYSGVLRTQYIIVQYLAPDDEIELEGVAQGVASYGGTLP
jgi:hypothetical protein